MTNSSAAELLSFEEIAAELKRRFPFYILVTLRDAEKDSSTTEEIRVNYGGSPTLVLGLIARGKRILRKAVEVTEEPNE